MGRLAGRNDLRVPALLAESIGPEVLPAKHAGVGRRAQGRQRTHVGVLEERFQQPGRGANQRRQIAGQFCPRTAGVCGDGDGVARGYTTPVSSSETVHSRFWTSTSWERSLDDTTLG